MALFLKFKLMNCKIWYVVYVRNNIMIINFIFNSYFEKISSIFPGKIN